MAHKKRGKKLFRWNKSELPDNDANTQVLLLGVTRLDTPPRSSPPKFIKPKRPHTYHAPETTTSDVYDTFWINRPPAPPTTKSTTTFLSIKSKRNLNTFLGRFNRNSSEKDVEDASDATRLINWPLVVVEPNECQNDEKHSTHVNRDDNIPKTLSSFRVKKSKTARLTSCIPSCANRHESSETPSSLASSFRIAECCEPITSDHSNDNKRNTNSNNPITNYRREQHQRQHLIVQLNRLRSPNALIPTNLNRLSNKSTQRNQNSGSTATTNNNSNLFNNLNIMDRSVDSIGSCSLDVDAESTDFSDTSGSLNVCTPLSGKDFTREFTSRIHERCQLPPVHAQQTKTILDPNSGKISTIISPPIAIDDISSPQQTTPPAKKPSYLNLACCVNGYSNLTTYDSKFRQSINKSREVSPIRPITHTVQYNRGESNYLVVPVPMPIINDHNRTTSMMDAHTILSPEKRFFSQQTQQKMLDMNATTTPTTKTATSMTGGRDITDNINSNGCTAYFKKTMMTSTTSTTMTSNKDGGNDAAAAKSFIQQRVERLYGPGALAQGLYSPKKPKQFEENGASVSLASILVEKSQNSSKFNGYSANTYATNGSSTADVENVNLDASNEAPLPVLRHLRPEFRAQLPMLSPKRTTPVKVTSVDIATTTTTSSSSTSSNGKYENGIDVVSPNNGVSNNSSYCSGSSSCSSIAKPMTNGCINTNTKHRISYSNADDENSLTSTKCDTEYSTSSSTSSHNTSITEIINSMSKVRLSDLDRSHNESSNGQSSASMAAAASQPIASSPPKRSPIAAEASTSHASTITHIEPDANGNHKTETQSKDALYFLETVHSERDRLIAMAVEIEKELDKLLQRDDIDEEMLGHLRSAAGKARLLATQKFKQFEGLCNNCLNQVSGDSFPPPTPGDLQGFWEMVMLQVNHVDSLYTELSVYRANNWKIPAKEKPKAASQGTKSTKRPTAPKASTAPATAASTAKKSAASIAAAQKREEQRKKLMEMKRKHKLAMTTENTSDPASPTVILEQRNGKNSVGSSGDGQSNETSETDR